MVEDKLEVLVISDVLDEKVEDMAIDMYSIDMDKMTLRISIPKT